jgi:Zinc-binding loop region of homing endonuclease
MGDSKKNKPRGPSDPAEWPVNVWDTFQRKLEANVSSAKKPYFEVFTPQGELPPALQHDPCHHPSGSSSMTVNLNDFEYQRPLHRIRHLLQQRQKGKILTTEEQSSHLCMDFANEDGRGTKHCCNPEHLAVEDDKKNKERQRCAGWVFVHPYKANPGNFWYPTCTHQPPCKRYTPKEKKPSQLND